MPTRRTKPTSKQTKQANPDITAASALDELQTVDSDAAAQILHVRRDTLTVWRCRGVGPPFVRLPRGGVRYLLADLKQYIQQGRVVPKGTVEVST